MNRKHFTVALCALMAISLAALATVLNEDRVVEKAAKSLPDRAPVGVRRSAAAVPNDLNRLKAVAKLRRDLGCRADLGLCGREEGEPDEDNSELDAEQEERALIVNSAVEMMDRTLEQEGENDRWTEDVIAFSKDLLLDGSLEGTSLVKVDCRQTMCKAVFLHQDDESFEIFGESVGKDSPWSGDRTRINDKRDNGEIEVSMFFKRRMEEEPEDSVN